ncbi:hypothetical protein CLHUN_01480 [Ruminiclostridium hungatei]|uniref:Helix-turn-helix domain protein n=1 Tax=Ruminiclostridium hungatei TaxID=48256 RepID=A0A1V4SR45_RUMHU|nr:hypothetical protein [Ruminiclostridium hungatei]OPX46332.1 hypothetical protein CLHUN_01480 [Ruminiclostridium hungatei]
MLIGKEGQVLDIKETVQFFDGHISEWMIRQMVASGEIPHFRMGNKKLLFDADKLKLWWENKLNQSVQPSQGGGKEKSELCGTLRKIKI